MKRTARVIDAHHHFWKYNPEEYGWISDAMGPLRRDYLPEELSREMEACGVHGTVAVQARETLDETSWLLDLAGMHSWISGVVGWVPLAGPGLEGALGRFAGRKKWKGVREVLQHRPPGALLEHSFNQGIRLLPEHGLTYDLLINSSQLEEATAFVDRHPEQLFVLDHAAKPPIRGDGWGVWSLHIRELARCPRVYCKVSGLATEADWNRWTPDSLEPYWTLLLEAFGPRRLMWGTDWPVCLLATGYTHWRKTVEGWTSGLSPDERERILGGTATEAYGLEEHA